jgi:plasmid stabilization system protein ParE
MSQYELHPEAKADLDEISEYIAADSVESAERVISEILARIKNLASSPYTGRRRPDLTGAPLRFVCARNYLIAYSPDRKPLLVVAIAHASRSPRVIAAMLRGRE